MFAARYHHHDGRCNHHALTTLGGFFAQGFVGCGDAQSHFGEHAEAIGQRLGGNRAVFHFLPIGGQQQPGFQPGQPRRHHQPVGGQFQAHAAGALDHREELLHQRQNGDLRQIDFLCAREVEQQVQRPLEPVQPQQQAVTGWRGIRSIGRHAGRGRPA